MTSIIPNKNKKEKQRKTKRWPIVFWLMIWQAASVFVGQEILLASPAAVLKRLFTLVTEPVFWQSLLFSGARIGAGFFLGAAAGIAGAALAGRKKEPSTMPTISRQLSCQYSSTSCAATRSI